MTGVLPASEARGATTYNNALPLFMVKYNLKWINSLLIANSLCYIAHLFIGCKHRQGEGLCGPVQRRRECETLYEIGPPMFFIYDKEYSDEAFDRLRFLADIDTLGTFLG